MLQPPKRGTGRALGLGWSPAGKLARVGRHEILSRILGRGHLDLLILFTMPISLNIRVKLKIGSSWGTVSDLLDKN